MSIPAILSSTYFFSDIPFLLKDVNIIVCISTDNAIKEDANKLGEMLLTPVITSSPNIAPTGTFTVSMYPDFELANRVMVDSLKYWKINPVALMYDGKLFGVRWVSHIYLYNNESSFRIIGREPCIIIVHTHRRCHLMA